jgi:hypothetical protein
MGGPDAEHGEADAELGEAEREQQHKVVRRDVEGMGERQRRSDN